MFQMLRAPAFLDVLQQLSSHLTGCLDEDASDSAARSCDGVMAPNNEQKELNWDVACVQDDRKAVQKAREAVKLPENLAKEILKDTTRKCTPSVCFSMIIRLFSDSRTADNP